MSADVVRSYWAAVSAREWDSAQALLSPVFVAEWPQTRERFRDAESYIAMNRAYPGEHRIEIDRVTSSGDRVITEVRIVTNGGEQDLFAISVFQVRGGQILRATEYWAHRYEAPEWRAQWVERY